MHVHHMEHPMDTLFRGLIKLVLLGSAAIVVTGVLLIGLSAALLTLVWSLLTGRRPAAWTTFMRFRKASRSFQNGNWPGRAAPAASSNADIVDVQAHEVRGVLDDRR
jgi:hypothetical protein